MSSFLNYLVFCYNYLMLILLSLYIFCMYLTVSSYHKAFTRKHNCMHTHSMSKTCMYGLPSQLCICTCGGHGSGSLNVLQHVCQQGRSPSAQVVACGLQLLFFMESIYCVFWSTRTVDSALAVTFDMFMLSYIYLRPLIFMDLDL